MEDTATTTSTPCCITANGLTQLTFVTLKPANKEGNHKLTIYTDGSKSEHGTGSRIIIFKDQQLLYRLKYRLNYRSTNNQAEQLAVMKSLDKILEIHLEDHQQNTAAIYTDSLITLQSIANVNNHNFLVEKIRGKIRTLESCNWKLELSRIKAHVGILGNELADRTAKEAEQDVELKECYSKIPIIP